MNVSCYIQHLNKVNCSRYRRLNTASVVLKWEGRACNAHIKNMLNIGERSEQDRGICMLTIRLIGTYNFLHLTVDTLSEAELMLKFENNFQCFYRGRKQKHRFMERGGRELCCAWEKGTNVRHFRFILGRVYKLLPHLICTLIKQKRVN